MDEQREKVELSKGQRYFRFLMMVMLATLVFPLLVDLFYNAVIPGKSKEVLFFNPILSFMILTNALPLISTSRQRKTIKFWLCWLGLLMPFCIGGDVIVCAVRGYNFDWSWTLFYIVFYTPLFVLVGIKMEKEKGMGKDKKNVYREIDDKKNVYRQ